MRVQIVFVDVNALIFFLENHAITSVFCISAFGVFLIQIFPIQIYSSVWDTYTLPTYLINEGTQYWRERRKKYTKYSAFLMVGG